MIMKGAVSTVVLVLIAAVVVAAVYSYYNSTQSPTLPTGRSVTDKATGDVGNLGFLESCNPNRDRCDVGLICELGRDNVYRCLRIG